MLVRRGAPSIDLPVASQSKIHRSILDRLDWYCAPAALCQPPSSQEVGISRRDDVVAADVLFGRCSTGTIPPPERACGSASVVLGRWRIG